MSYPNKPKITVGMPTYNRAEYLKTSIPLVLNQTFSNFEFIICDDCSTDNTSEVVKSFSDSRIRYYRNEKNLNIPGILNKILELSNGEYIVILHDHDIFDPKLIEKMYDLLEKNPDVGFVHPGVAWVNSNGTNRKELLMDFPEIMDGKELLDKMLLSDSFASPICACGLVRRSTLKEAGLCYDPSFGFVSDIDLWFRLSMKYKVGYIREAILTCREREEDHQFYNVSWQMHKWLIELFRENIKRRFGEDKKAFDNAMAIWKRKKDRLYRNTMIKLLIDGNYQSFRDGMTESKILRSKVASYLISPALFSFASKLFYSINKFRKILKNIVNYRNAQKNS